jgi:hypothetical protein
MKPAELLQHINALHRTTFELVEQYPDGEQGAFAITDQSTSERYITRGQNGQIQHLVDRLIGRKDAMVARDLTQGHVDGLDCIGRIDYVE